MTCFEKNLMSKQSVIADLAVQAGHKGARSQLHTLQLQLLHTRHVYVLQSTSTIGSHYISPAFQGRLC